MKIEITPAPLLAFELDAPIPTTAYGDLLTAQLSPEIQVSADYNSIGQVDVIATGTSTVGAEGGEFFATSGTGATDIAALFSKNQIIPRHGQGSLFRFPARFEAGVADMRSAAGASTASDSIVFGYEGVDFGLFYTHDGAVVVYELQVTVGASGSENATVTINGTGYTVPLTSSSVEENAFEIAESLTSQVPLYNFSQNGDTVVMRSLFAAPETGAFTFSSATATGVFTQIAAGVEPTRDFTAQTDWSVNTKPDLDPSKTNYYSIRHNGDVEYYVQDQTTGAEILVHRQGLPNTRSGPIFGNASFRMVWSVSNLGSTTPVTVRGSHGAAFVEGIEKMKLPTHSARGISASIGTTLTNVLTIRNRIVFGTKVNLGRVIPSLVSVFSEAVRGSEVEVLLNADVAGITNFEYVDKEGSIVEVDRTASAVTGGTLLDSEVFLEDAKIDLSVFNELIQSGNSLTIAMRSLQNPASDMVGTAVWEEEK